MSSSLNADSSNVTLLFILYKHLMIWASFLQFSNISSNSISIFSSRLYSDSNFDLTSCKNFETIALLGFSFDILNVCSILFPWLSLITSFIITLLRAFLYSTFIVTVKSSGFWFVFPSFPSNLLSSKKPDIS